MYKSKINLLKPKIPNFLHIITSLIPKVNHLTLYLPLLTLSDFQDTQKLLTKMTITFAKDPY
jgi:hypothetical protein